MIEEEWGLFDYRELKAFWQDQVPPHEALLFVGSALGVKWEKVRELLSGSGGRGGEMQIAAGGGLSIAELSKRITPPKDMGATLAASAETLQLLLPPNGEGGPA